MKNKLILLALIPTLVGCSCGGHPDPLYESYESAIDLGTLTLKGKDSTLTYDYSSAQKDAIVYYKFSVSEKITFNSEGGYALSIVAYDTHENYENYSMLFDIVLYDLALQSIKTITFKEFSIQYDGGDSSEFTGNTGLGCYIVDSEVEPGDYFFSLTPKADVFENHYLVWVSTSIGD